MLKALEGKKTYIAAAIGILISLGGAYFGVISHDAAAEIFVGSLGLVGVRSAMAQMAADKLIAAAEERGKERTTLK